MNTNNNFDFLRHFAAFIVLYGHSFDLCGEVWHKNFYSINGVNYTTLALIIFFSISGYLITSSYQNSSNIFTYLKKRCLRLFPALWVNIILIWLFLFLFVREVSVHEFFSDKNSWLYFASLTIIKTHTYIDTIFAQNPYAHSINGSLWTLAYEFYFYLLVPLLSLLYFYKSRWAYLILIIVLFVLYVYLNEHTVKYGIPIIGLNLLNFSAFGFYFFFCGWIYLFANHFTKKLKEVSILFIISILIVIFFERFDLFYLIFPIFIINIGTASWPFINRIGNYGDISYGLYIYAFPIQQSIMYFNGGSINPFILVLLTLLFTTPIALLSWVFIEKKALKLKNKKLFNGLI